MEVFAKFVVVACLGLLSWWQADLHLDWGPATVAPMGLALLAVVLTANSKRHGYWLAALLGLGHLAEILFRLPPGQLLHVQPLLFWSVALTLCAAGLLWASRERRARKPVYERHSEYH